MEMYIFGKGKEHRDNLSQLTRLWKFFGEVHGWQKSAVGCKRREGLAIVELKQSGLDKV